MENKDTIGLSNQFKVTQCLMVYEEVYSLLNRKPTDKNQPAHTHASISSVVRVSD